MADKNTSAIHRELERKSQDLIKIHNITDEPYEILWDGFKFPVPSKNQDNGHGKGTAVVPRYVALNYIKHMTDKILTERSDNAVAKENERRVKNGMQPMTKYQEQLIFEGEYRINNIEARKEVLKMLWGGISQEYGVGDIKSEPEQKKRDNRPIDEQLLEELDFPVEVEKRARVVSESLPEQTTTQEDTTEAKQEVINRLQNTNT